MKRHYIYQNILFLLLLLNYSNALVLRSNTNEIVKISLNTICMETKKILLGQQDVELKIQLSQIPISSINITFISDNNFKNFDVVPKSLFFDGKYTSIQLEGNTTINVKNSNIKDNNPVIKSFKLKSKKTGSSKLSFDIQSDGNNIQLDEFLNDKLDITVNVVAYPITSIILMVSTAMFLFCIGLSLSGNTLRGTFHKERIPPILCGLICQFVIVPLISILIPKLFKQNNIQVLSVFMVGISPSSVIAPIFTYYLGGDRALAVSLCLISTILGSAVYVIYLYVYLMFFSRSLELTTFPYEGVAFIVIYCLVPLLLGSLLLHFKPLWASWLNKGATFWGALIILTSLIVSLKDAGSVFLSQWYIYCVSIILTSLSFGISVIMSKIFRLNSKKTRAICMNTALPNIPLAITIIQVYINPCCSQILSAFPLFHTFWMLIETIIIVIDNIKKSDIDTQTHKRSYSFQVGNTFNNINKKDDDDDDNDTPTTTATPSPELLKVNDILNNTSNNHFSPGNSPASGTPSINSMITKTKNGNTKSIANTYIKGNDNHQKISESELNVTPNFNSNNNSIKQSSHNSTTLPVTLNIDTSKKSKSLQESVKIKPESLYSALETPASENSNSVSYEVNTTISPYNLNANSLLSSDIGSSYLRNYSNSGTPFTDNKNTSLASKVFGMSVSQAVSCVPEPIITEKLRDKENDKDNEKKNQKGNGKEMEMENGKGKEEFQPNDADTNEVNSATTFCTTKTDFSSPNSSNPSATKDTSSKLKQYDVIPTPIYQVSLDLPLKQNTSHLDQSPKQKSSLTDKFIPINEDDNQHNYKSSVTSFFNSLDDSVDFQSYTNSVKGLEMSESHQQQQQFTKSNLPPQGLDNVIIATTNSYSSFSSALTSPLARPIPSTTEPEEYVIPQPPEITLNNFDLDDLSYNPQRVSLISSMSYTTFQSCQTESSELSEFEDCIPEDNNKENNN
ncbi:hypothetical protein H8356DRAFT_1298491 [Neocallimastix lanati (nom. inval.)]|uniref:SBF-domain-containing protein n=1 Tax=Neocallimastix californiae TaxID=1754190 RepID=A0A1Y2A1W9_9FUNG|nr:hypothetical protein H8356DRAFT_1298491 [Neocallimastix sp. JGI-2020a]ORY16509.1 hypothetical protein LY90DRAFT_677439 [Neocallimastix californiae]|eukprot:ORY16509.1 hypothetical protein LY90DRAFT_677439 [Neocallimastix californiae]